MVKVKSMRRREGSVSVPGPSVAINMSSSESLGPGPSTTRENDSSLNSIGYASMTRSSISRTSPRVHNSLSLYTRGLHIDNNHRMKEERELMEVFLLKMKTLNEQSNFLPSSMLLSLQIPIEISRNCIFIKPMLRYNNKAQRALQERNMKKDKTLDDDKSPIFSGHEATTIGSIVWMIQMIFAYQERERSEQQINPLPIIFIVSGELKRTVWSPVTYHCSVIVLQKKNDGSVIAYLKDSKIISKMSVLSKAVQLCRRLGVNTLQVIPEVHESSSNCLLEAIRFCGQIFDGSSSLENLGQLSYNVKGGIFFSSIKQKEINGDHCLDVEMYGEYNRFIDRKVQEYMDNDGKNLSQQQLKSSICRLVAQAKIEYEKRSN